MRARAAVLVSSILSASVSLLACKRDQRAPSDCDVVQKDPGNAVAALSGRYPGERVKVAEIIERCVAPAGAPCERLAKIITAIPNLMPAGSPALAAPANVAELCAGMPPEMQRCMLPSYTLAHSDECMKVFGAMAQAAAGAGSGGGSGAGAGAGSGAAAPPCQELKIELASNAITLRREAVRTLERTGGKTDTNTLSAALGELAARCTGRVAITSADDLSYQDMVSIMDAAGAAGFRQLGLDVPGAPAAPPAPSPAPSDRAGGPPGDMSSAPVILVTKQGVSLAGTVVTNLTADVTESLAKALATLRASDPKLTRVAVLQAEASTPMRTINQVVTAARRAGFDDLLFATKMR